METRSICGSDMRLDPDDPGLSTDLLEDSIREPHTTRAYQSALQRWGETENLTIVDIGANIGYYALQPCALLDNAHVLAIEPDSENASLLRENVLLNGYRDRMDVVEAGVGATTATVPMHLAAESNLHTMNERKAQMAGVGAYGSDTVDVPVHPLDDLLDMIGIPPADVDVIRMDIEGYEGQAIRGMDAVFERNDRLLCNIEFHPVLMDSDENARLRKRFGDCAALSVAQGDTEFSDKTVGDALNRNWAEAVFEWRAG